MRNKFLILVGAFALPMVSSAQNVVFYNKGKMSVITTTSNANATLYIGGSLVAARDATDDAVFCDILLKDTKIVLTGNLLHNAGISTGVNDCHVFRYNGDTATPGVVGVETGTFVPPGIQTNPSILEFRGGGVAQKVTTVFTDDNTKRKARNYIKFPNVVVNNTGHVTVDQQLTAAVDNMDLDEGRFILDTKRLDATTTSTAHLYMPFGAKITYNKATTPGAGWATQLSGGKVDNVNKFGSIQVNLAVDDPAASEASKQNGRSLIGMGSPYKKIAADYFMWNFLFIPADDGKFISSTQPSIANPSTGLAAGQGFAIAVDLRGTNSSNYYMQPALVTAGISFAARATEKYEFSRFSDFAFNNANNIYPLDRVAPAPIKPNTFTSVSVNDAAYTDEVISTDNVPFTLRPGWNYLSNPFLTPLNLFELTQDGVANSWNLTPGTLGGGDIVNRVWIMASDARASGEYDIPSTNPSTTPPTGNAFTTIVAITKYNVMLKAGATATNNTAYANADGTTYTIAPLQMFVLHAEAGITKTIQIPQRQRVIGGTRFLRSTENTESKLRDDFLFEVYDQTSKQTSRASVVLRTPQEIQNDMNYTDVKKVTARIESTGTNSVPKSTMLEGVIEQTYGSYLYTKGGEDDALEAKFLPFTKSMDVATTDLYLTPSLTAQKVTINAYRLGTKDAAKEVWLDDKLLNKSVLLTEEAPSYETTTNPTDNPNRFKVRFARAITGIGPDETNEVDHGIKAYYSNNVLTVSGFEDIDLGSKLSVYDIQGRSLNKTEVNNYEMKISITLAPGVYVVKVVGNKSHVTKFLVK